MAPPPSFRTRDEYEDLEEPDDYGDQGSDFNNDYTSDNDDVVIAVMGSTGSGKSSFIKLLSGNATVKTGDNLESETLNVRPIEFFDQVSRRKVVLVDTPGFDDSREGITNTEVLKRITGFLLKEYDNNRKLDGIVYTHSIANTRFTGQSTHNLKMFKNLCGDKSYKNVVLLTTFWDDVSARKMGEKREAELKSKFCRELAQGGATFMRHNRTKSSAQKVLDYILTLDPTDVLITREIREEGKALENTTAGSVHRAEVEALIAKHKAEVAELRAEIKSMKDANDKIKREFTKERAEMQTRLGRLEKEKSELSDGLAYETRARMALDDMVKQSKEEHVKREQYWDKRFYDQTEKQTNDLKDMEGKFEQRGKQRQARFSRPISSPGTGTTLSQDTTPSNFTASSTPQHPIVLMHGFTDIPQITGSFEEYERVLTPQNYLLVRMPPIGSIAERSDSAMNQITQKFSGRSVHLIGMSMGGLNARDIAARVARMPNPPFSVKTVTTVGTPNRGVRAIDFVPGVDGKQVFMRTMRTLFGTDFGGLGNLSASFVSRFNADTPNDPNVRYFSWAGFIRVPTPIFLTYLVKSSATFPISVLFGRTDGLVNVDSARWGTHLGDFAGRDHIVALLSRDIIELTLPHLAAAEGNESAPILPIENGLLTSGMRRIKGDLNLIKTVSMIPTRLVESALSE
ncbi:hypothetical protein D9757_010653 [Collybiopsis confluens]|uniref:G domain-containing protein n=1 Tax=Collybiopsis confluens TaxID=2823264 RepID=A0A8H5LRS0_9AGAR|nr:hypothetical protein D9757_010653 [Collybiopsis confluens]